MNIIDEAARGSETTPYAVGTANATQDVYHHVKPGRERANFFRYFRFNLPRLTKAVLVAVVATIGATSASVASSTHLPFPHGNVALWLVFAMAVVFVALALATRWAIWDFGSLIAAAACAVYAAGCAGNAPFVWNGASLELAATWNLMMIMSVAYFILNWAVDFGVLAVWPHTQGFTD